MDLPRSVDENLGQAIDSVDRAITLNQQELSRLCELQQFLISKMEENHQMFESANNADGEENDEIDESISDTTNLTTFAYPYFKDDRGFSAPENKDTLTLRSIGFENSDDLKVRKKYWPKSTCKRLEELVLSEFRGRSVADLTESRNSIASRLQVLQSIVDEETPKEDLNEIERKKERMSELTALITERLADVTIPSREDSEHLDWLRIAANMSLPFTDVDCKLKWINDLHPDINKDPFTDEEVEVIKESVTKGDKSCDWNDLAEKLSEPGKLRLPWQVCKYYQSHLNEETKRVGPLSDEERELLELLINENTNKNNGEIDWQSITYHMHGRTVAQLKLYWNKKNSLKKGHEWSRFEDRVLVAAVEKFGESSWNQVAHYVYGRTNRQCRERWTNRLSVKNRKGGDWTKEEDERLVTLASEFEFKWSQLQKEFPGRSERQLSTRFSLISHWFDSGQVAKFLGDDPKRTTIHIAIKSQPLDKIRVFLSEQLSSENALMRYLEESREKLKVQFEKGHQVPILIEDEGDKVDRELIEFFSYHNAWDNCKNRKVALSANDTLLYETLTIQLSKLIDGEDVEPSNALQEVTQSAISRDVSRRVSQLMADHYQERASLFILPPNLVTLRGLQGLLLQEDRLKKIITDSGLDLDEAMAKYTLDDPCHRKLFTRFLSLFFWPLICSLENAPSISSPTAESVSESISIESKAKRHEQISGLVQIRDRQNWLFKSATDDNHKLAKVYKAFSSAKSAGKEASISKEDLDAAFQLPSTSRSSQVDTPNSSLAETASQSKGGRKRKKTADTISHSASSSPAASQVETPVHTKVIRKSGRERTPARRFNI